MIRPTFGEASDAKSYEATLEIFEDICKLLHPFMPFITEEIWHQLKERPGGEDCMMALLADAMGKGDKDVVGLFDHVLDVKSSVLELRNQHQLSPKEQMDLIFPNDPSLVKLWNTPGAKFVLKKLANAACDQGEGTGVSFLAGKYQYYAALAIHVDAASEIERMKEEIIYFEGFLKSVDKKLGNEKFVANAHPDVVEKEKQKKADALSKIEQLQKSIEQLN